MYEYIYNQYSTLIYIYLFRAMSDPMLHADPGTPFVPWTLSDFGGATNDTGVFSEAPVGSDLLYITLNKYCSAIHHTKFTTKY